MHGASFAVIRTQLGQERSQNAPWHARQSILVQHVIGPGQEFVSNKCLANAGIVLRTPPETRPPKLGERHILVQHESQTLHVPARGSVPRVNLQSLKKVEFRNGLQHRIHGDVGIIDFQFAQARILLRRRCQFSPHSIGRRRCFVVALYPPQTEANFQFAQGRVRAQGLGQVNNGLRCCFVDLGRADSANGQARVLVQKVSRDTAPVSRQVVTKVQVELDELTLGTELVEWQSHFHKQCELGQLVVIRHLLAVFCKCIFDSFPYKVHLQVSNRTVRMLEPVSEIWLFCKGVVGHLHRKGLQIFNFHHLASQLLENLDSIVQRRLRRRRRACPQAILILHRGHTALARSHEGKFGRTDPQALQ
mmetsp:Transcript_4540/g.12605  ORF Transcript_4540/g.12605 Transcript_4540/m.12605 type:complete len:362 (-) Transcript_4540:273-1358(-)